MLEVGDVIERPGFVVIHKGLYLGANEVLHNVPEKGEHISSFEEFSEGKVVRFSKVKDESRWSIVMKSKEAARLRRQYNVLANNCEHTVNRIINGVAESQQLRIFLMVCLVVAVGAGFMYVASRSKGGMA